MIKFYEILNLNGLTWSIGVDRETDTEFDSEFKIVFGVDYCGDPIIYDYWGNMECFLPLEVE